MMEPLSTREIELEAEQRRAEAQEDATAIVRDHLRDFLARNPGATYESWIAALHPENIQLDHRLRIANNPWLTVWAETGRNLPLKQVGCLNGVLVVLSGVWAGLCLFMWNLKTHYVRGTTQLVGTATALSIILFFIQLVSSASFLIAAFRRESWLESWPRHVYKVNIGQLVVQTYVTIVMLTGFMFNQHGLSLHSCLWETSCVTCMDCMRRMGVLQEGTEWVETDNGVLSDGPFSLVSISIDRTTRKGHTYPTAHMTNNGAPWEGIKIQASVARVVSFTSLEKTIMCMTVLFYILAILNVSLYVWAYRVSGQRRGQRLREWLSFKRMELFACFLCFSLIVTSSWGFVLNPDALFVAPVSIGIATFIALLQKFLTTLGKRNPPSGPFSRFQKRSITGQGVGVMVAFTYVAGLCDSIIICSAARIWPTSLNSAGLKVFIWSCLIHLFLSVGYGASIWANFHLMRLRSVQQAQDSRASSTVCNQEAPPIDQTSAQQSRPDPPACEQDERECVICMDDLRDTVLLTCGHLALCNGCATHLMQSRRPLCPVCRGEVDDIQRVYMA